MQGHFSFCFPKMRGLSVSRGTSARQGTESSIRVCGGFSKNPFSLAPLEGTLLAGRYGMLDSREKPSGVLKLLSYLAFTF